jgi:tRNA (cmo5U34)-methyltransferase
MMADVYQLAGYWMNVGNVRNFLSKASYLPHRREGDAVLTRSIPANARRILDLGTGDGHLIALLMQSHPKAEFVGIDISPHMLVAATERFHGDDRVSLYERDLNQSPGCLGQFDAVISSLATHHLTPSGLTRLYSDIFELLSPGGVFCNLDHVAPSTDDAHYYFYDLLGEIADCFDGFHSQPLAVAQHLRLLREVEFNEVACRWHWLEMALMIASRAPLIESVRPSEPCSSPVCTPCSSEIAGRVASCGEPPVLADA